MRKNGIRILLLIATLFSLQGQAMAEISRDTPQGRCYLAWNNSTCDFEATGSLGELVIVFETDTGAYTLYGPGVSEHGSFPETSGRVVTKLVTGFIPGMIYRFEVNYSWMFDASITTHTGPAVGDAKYLVARKRGQGDMGTGTVIHGCTAGLEVCVDVVMKESWLYGGPGDQLLCTAVDGDFNEMVSVSCWMYSTDGVHAETGGEGYGRATALIPFSSPGGVTYRVCVRGWARAPESYTPVFCENTLL